MRQENLIWLPKTANAQFINLEPDNAFEHYEINTKQESSIVPCLLSNTASFHLQSMRRWDRLMC